MVLTKQNDDGDGDDDDDDGDDYDAGADDNDGDDDDDDDEEKHCVINLKSFGGTKGILEHMLPHPSNSLLLPFPWKRYLYVTQLRYLKSMTATPAQASIP